MNSSYELLVPRIPAVVRARYGPVKRHSARNYTTICRLADIFNG